MNIIDEIVETIKEIDIKEVYGKSLLRNRRKEQVLKIRDCIADIGKYEVVGDKQNNLILKDGNGDYFRVQITSCPYIGDEYDANNVLSNKYPWNSYVHYEDRDECSKKRAFGSLYKSITKKF